MGIEDDEGGPARPQEGRHPDGADRRAVPDRPHHREARGGDRDREAHRVASSERGEGGERRLEPCVPDLEPRESGEQRPPEPLDEDPGARHPPEGGRRGRSGYRPEDGAGSRAGSRVGAAGSQEPGARPAEDAGIESQQAHEEAGQRDRRAEADVAILEALRDPPDTGPEPGRPEEPAAPERAARARVQYGPEQHGERRHRDQREVPGREGEEHQPPGHDACPIQPCRRAHGEPCGLPDFRGGFRPPYPPASTRNRCTRRRSARSTEKRRSPRVSSSPRSGR